ncbi:MAG: TIGR01777 family protein, partial [Marivirga sp.]|nr:TIGR01777 family protein [Marivirga sp.]
HLAGAGIADKPWTEERKREILESRTNSTRLLFDELKKGDHTVNVFISSSAIGYYGFGDKQEIFTEESNPGNDFLATVTRHWEKEVDAISALGIRVIKVRTGIVLSEKGGALMEIVKPVKFFAGAPLGSGEQYMSWIHLDDLCGLFIKAVEDPAMSGAYNGVAPNPVTNRDLTVTIARTLHKPLILPAIPAFVLKLLLGEMADLVLRGSKVSPQKILRAGYRFKFENLNEALADLLMKK